LLSNMWMQPLGTGGSGRVVHLYVGIVGGRGVVVRSVGEEGGMSVDRVKPRGSEGATLSGESTGASEILSCGAPCIFS